jgi:predicted DNA-binding antitoxin AbrB/MazE fold protein
MNQTITAVFENGVLRPLTSLDLPEHTEVQVTIIILPPSAAAELERQRVRAALIAAGVTLPLQESPRTPPLSDEEREGR